MELLEIDIPTFVNTNLFWVIEKGSDKRTKQLDEIESLMKTTFDGQTNEQRLLYVGDIVALSIDNYYYRATIEEVSKPNNAVVYMCWLIDFGRMVETESAFKLSPKLKRFEPLSHQACLNNIILDPKADVRSAAMNILNTADKLQFQTTTRSEGVLFGDILYREDADMMSLSAVLVAQGLSILDATLFHDVMKNIHDYRESQLNLTNEICKENSKHNRTLDIVEQYLQEFVEKDCTKNGRASDASVISELDESKDKIGDYSKHSMSHTDSDSGHRPPTRIKLLADKIKRQQRFKAESESSSSPNSRTTTSEPFQSPNTCATKSLLPGKVQFIPGGATFSLLSPNKTEPFKRRNGLIRKRPDRNSEPCSDSTSTRASDIESKSTSLSHMSRRPETMLSDVKSEASSRTRPEVTTLNLKPLCSCTNCDHWTHEDDFDSTKRFISKRGEKKVIGQHRAPPLLLKREGETNEGLEIVALEYQQMTKIERQKTKKLLIQGDTFPSPIKLISDANFHSIVYKRMVDLRYAEAKKIQYYVWPAIMRNQNVCIVNGAKGGKSMSYIPAICTFQLEKEERYQNITKSGGPIVVILSRNSAKCEEIYDLLLTFGMNRRKVHLVTYPISHVHTNNLDVLVTMPNVLVDLLKSNATNLKRMCHLVIDDADGLLIKSSEILDKILNVTQEMLTHRVFYKSVQLIVCANHWSVKLRNFIDKFRKLPLVCIGNYIEAALYGGTDIGLKMLTAAYKEQEIKALLRDRFHIHKSVIVCDQSELEDVQTMLLVKGIESTIITHDSSKEDIYYLEELWNTAAPGNYRVLVCTDFMLNSMLTVTNATFLIHYSLPDSWTKFVRRFSTLLESIESPLVAPKYACKCESAVLVDENDIKRIPKFLDFFKSLQIALPAELNEILNTTKDTDECEKVTQGVSLCENTCIFGKCWEKRCSSRHVLDKELDSGNNLPKTGLVQFKIVDILDVTSFTAKLLPLDDDTSLAEELTSVLKVSKVQARNLKLKHSYAYYDIDVEEVFHRCELIGQEDEDFYTIKLLDKGMVFKTLKSRLYDLPPEFKSRPPKTVDVYLANFVPPYDDNIFSAKSYAYVKELLRKQDYSNITLTGTVYLALQNTLWLKNVYQEIVVQNITACKFNLTKSIVDLKVAQISKTPLSNLYKLCEAAGIPVPSYEGKLTNATETAQIKPQWAFLESSDRPHEVIFCAAVNPDEFYVRLAKFDDILLQLEKEIQVIASKASYKRAVVPKIGGCYLIKDVQTEEYSRVVVFNLDGAVKKAHCFCADYGDDLIVDYDELVYLSDKFIAQLPFQAIQCQLYGVQPVLDAWQDKATSILYTYGTMPNESSVHRQLFVQVRGKEGAAGVCMQNCYSVLLKDGFGGRRILINNLLVDCGLAMLKDGEKFSDFELVEEVAEDSVETDEEVERVKDICRISEMDNKFVPNKPCPEGENEDDDEMELFLDDGKAFIEQLRKSLIGGDSTPIESPRVLPAIKAVPQVEYYTPAVLWSQTEFIIKLIIELPVRECKLSLTKGRIFNFKASVGEKNYQLKLVLFQTIKSFQHTIVGAEIRIKLFKNQNDLWSRLILSKDRFRNIHYNMNDLKCDPDKKKKRFLELPKGSDDEEEIDLEIMYHDVSDRDSEYALDHDDSSD